ncbi:hypothetical protein ACIRQQ_36960 [Streptomyces fuscichromogenes]|uniref:hypothetical protein n=1 Tax=Streptomyces fuscichromogenes TaxID=1324013 RepID=UPI003830279B
MTAAQTPPSDYRLLVPRDWFRVDLTRERWRHQLKTFVDKESAEAGAPAEASRRVWTSLRNTAEHAVTKGALEFFLKTEAPGGSLLPASLLISMAPTPPGSAPEADDLAEVLTRRAENEADVEVIVLPAGRTVRVRTATTLEFHVRMPGDVGYLHMAFALPLSGSTGPMGDLCDAMAHSLRWVGTR